jgi:uncharacterized membrane protein
VTAPPQESQGHHLPFTSADIAADDPEVEARAADRVVVFSDAVVAIALLALDLAVPDSTNAWTNGQFLQGLIHNRGEYFAFLLSFVIIGGNWSAHRRTFRYVNRLNTLVGALNMIWLLMMILTPFAARLLAANGGFGVRFTIALIVVFLVSIPVAFALDTAWTFALWAAVPVLSRVLRRRLASGRHATS